MTGKWMPSILILAACSAAPQAIDEATALYYPRHEAPYGQGEMAGVEGSLAFRDGCIWLDTAAGPTFLPIWPSDTKPGVINSLPVVLMEDDGLVVETGETRNFAGSQTDPVRVEELVGPIPEQCGRNSFWVVTSVDRLP